MAQQLPLPLPQRPLPPQRGAARTQRKDAWWVQPLLVFLGLGAFVVYSTWAALQGEHYAWGPYLSPFYSPLLWDAPGQHTGHAWLGPWPGFLDWIPPLIATPALFILWAPGLFRFTCYYYRGAYYKAFWADPMNCAVGEPRKSYWGERWWPLVLQNLHRYFLYLAVLFLAILSYDGWAAMWWPVDEANQTHDGPREFGIGIGTLVLIINPLLLAGYTFGCHSLRHLIGGRINQFSRAPVQKRAYDCASCLNRRHMLWAWASLFWVGFSDFYVRMVSMGVWEEVRLI